MLPFLKIDLRESDNGKKQHFKSSKKGRYVGL